MVSRAFKNKVSCFKESKKAIIKYIFSLQKKNGSFGNDLDTALSLDILLNFNYSGKEVDLGIDYLLKRQEKNGAWRKAVLFLGPFPYRYYGSEELTTALSIEALKNYLKINGKKN